MGYEMIRSGKIQGLGLRSYLGMPQLLYLLSSIGRGHVGVSEDYLKVCEEVSVQAHKYGPLPAFPDYDNQFFEKEWFDEIMEVPFEYLMLPIPARYEECLTSQYGDWRTPVQGGSMHSGLIVDVDTPYEEHFRKKQ